jgi:predicted metal-binding membrane protein
MMIERILARDRLILLAGIAAITILAWFYTIREAQAMEAMHAGMDMTGVLMQSWTAQDAITMFLMWTIMMIAMMTPSAAPMVLIFDLHSRQRKANHRPYASAGVFLGGYLIAWTLFSALATMAQWLLQKYALLDMMMEPTSRIFGAAVLFAAGVFQFSPLKHACLRHCRSPLHFLTAQWRPGTYGALTMGIRHGLYCTGCCWFLMALLFVAGVMNLLWVAVIALFVLVEKAAPRGEWIARIAGGCLIAAGLWMLYRAFYA